MKPTVLHFITPPVPCIIDCGTNVYAPGEQHIRRRSIGVFDLIAVTRGTLFISEEDEQWSLKQGQMLILRPDALHYGFAPCTEPTEIVWIHFQIFGSWRTSESLQAAAEEQASLMESHRAKAYLHNRDLSSIFIQKHRSLSAQALSLLGHFSQLEQVPPTLRNWKRQDHFQALLHELKEEQALASDSTTAALARKIELFIRQNYALPITNKMLQIHLNYHPNYLAKCMSKMYGVTPVEYLLVYRMEQAKRLLAQTSYPIGKIAEEVGFVHTSHFTSHFTKREGLSPSKYRQVHSPVS
ncbi:AraC family transcriptional regulator [Paenibacillus sp. BIHB 4019]|uniref:AraC family transcriptional regulator n=1 Tax=Paenibacillus sp. BIHB 4019 TaxID=1870819 RepID=A0A1B2DDR6_9BACL|nr:AraC family transcriptional regulator [Paenibacillus sp. BIHB 4019]ANY65857.1 AraC family transcriptional regulator [Paenibacillus sp. BIHB 4019]